MTVDSRLPNRRLHSLRDSAIVWELQARFLFADGSCMLGQSCFHCPSMLSLSSQELIQSPQELMQSPQELIPTPASPTPEGRTWSFLRSSALKEEPRRGLSSFVSPDQL